MNTNEQNKRPDQEKVAHVAPGKGGDKNQPAKEPIATAGKERQDKSTS